MLCGPLAWGPRRKLYDSLVESHTEDNHPNAGLPRFG